MRMNAIAIFFLVAAAIGGLAYVFIYPILSGERAAERRRLGVVRSDPAARNAAAARGMPKVRREQVEDALKELESRRKRANSPPLAVRIEQAGLNWSKRTFFILSGVTALVVFVLLTAVGNMLLALAGAFAAGFGLPRWFLGYLKARREAKFLDNFPDSIDIVVRGIKAGLPLLDSMRIIVNDAPEPIRSEFKNILDTQAIGMPIGEACAKLYERIPLPEANFFGIVVSIQQKAGGNLSEALGNLSRVLRDRKKMKAKIKAMSMEAKASGAIIGALPVVVASVIYVTSPEFIRILFVHPVGHIMLGASAVWMLLGVLTMKKMINFDF